MAALAVCLPYSLTQSTKPQVPSAFRSGRFRGGLDEVMGLGLQRFVEAENVIGGDEKDDPRGRHAVNLVLQDVPDASLVVREGCLDGLAAVGALDDLRDV